jgi:hypothetical protein
MNFHDAYRSGTVTNLTYATSAGAAVSTAGFGTQTRYIYLTGKGVVAATTNGALLPFNWTQVVKVTPGEQLSTVSNDGVAGTLVVVELVD